MPDPLPDSTNFWRLSCADAKIAFLRPTGLHIWAATSTSSDLPNPALSVVLVTFNSSRVIGAALASINAWFPDAAIVVVDNGSTDATLRIVADSKATVIQGHGNIGFGAGVNLGVEASTTELILVINPDAELIESQTPREYGTSGPFGLVAAVERNLDGTEHPLLQPLLAWPVELIWSLTQWLVMPREFNPRKPSILVRQARLDGAAFFVDRTEFKSVGGFDERLFLYYEDEELSRRYAARGLPIRASRDVRVTHETGGSSPRTHERILAWTILSFVQMVSIHHGPTAMRRAAFVAIASLRFTATMGSRLSRLPTLGPRAHSSGTRANAMLQHLEAESREPPRGTTYPDSAPAVLQALKR